MTKVDVPLNKETKPTKAGRRKSHNTRVYTIIEILFNVE